MSIIYGSLSFKRFLLWVQKQRNYSKEVNLLPTDFKPGCVRPKSSITQKASLGEDSKNEKQEEKSMIKVGGPAPDFELAGYYQGGFKNFKLSEFKGKWVVLCFYPGDFTFV